MQELINLFVQSVFHSKYGAGLLFGHVLLFGAVQKSRDSRGFGLGGGFCTRHHLSIESSDF